jgi:hypothetical protein
MKLLIIALGLALPLAAAEFDITKFGATPDDAGDDTLAIRAAMSACAAAGGGDVIVPKGVFIVSRQKSETPILSIPSKTTVRGSDRRKGRRRKETRAVAGLPSPPHQHEPR